MFFISFCLLANDPLGTDTPTPGKLTFQLLVGLSHKLFALTKKAYVFFSCSFLFSLMDISFSVFNRLLFLFLFRF